jgi:hypothetical protein
MKSEVASVIRGTNLSGWKKVEVEYGARFPTRLVEV